jgi:hypothetical protein
MNKIKRAILKVDWLRFLIYGVGLPAWALYVVCKTIQLLDYIF